MDRLGQLQRELKRRRARLSFPDFLDYMDDKYERQWFHTLIAKKCQDLLLGKLGTNRLMVFVPPQHGKLLPADTPIWTTEGWKKHGELKRGDYVFGDDGRPKKVLANSGVYPWHVERLTFQNGQSILAAREHLWKMHVEYDDHKGRREIITETQHVFDHQHRRSPYLQCSPALETPERKLPIDPYILGLWLGDGLKNQGVIVSGEEDVRYLSQFGRVKQEREGYYRITIDGLRKALRLNGLLCNKHIPKNYLLSSKTQRTELLCGLMDSDGTCDRRGNCEFCQNEGQLAQDVYTLLRSLGYKARTKTYPATLYGREVGEKVRILFNPDRTDEVFHLPRKAERLRNKTKGDRSDKYRLFLTSIAPHGEVMGNCIQVEGGMYLAGEDFIPTHNSELVSRKLPAWALGWNPKMKIVGSSYAASLAQGFSRSIQRLIDSPEYREVFPATFLNSQNVPTDARRGYLRNIDIFETVGHGGFYKAVGIGGGLTGTPVDLGIIDDPVKDAMEAASPTYRERVWSWYTDVFTTRLHNNSKIIFIMTRWHDDDLAGRLLSCEPEKWTVICIPAIREDLEMKEDPRQIGEALWEERHSLARLREAEAQSPRTFAALYQQHPTIDGGNIIKREWFRHTTEAEFGRLHTTEPIVFFLDTAYTDKTDNDPSGIIATCKIGGNLYITHAEKVRMRFPDLVRFIPRYAAMHGYTRRSSIRIEPKANGLSVIDQLKETTGLNVVSTPTPRDSKETRLYAASPAVECGRVILVDGVWNEAFEDEICGFPAKPHDEYVDILGYAIDYHIGNPYKPIDFGRLAKLV